MNSTLTVKKNNELLIKRAMILIKAVLFVSILVFLIFFIADNVYAAVDPLAAVNKLKDFIAAFFEGIGIIAAFIGVAIFATSLMTHDPSQKVTGALAIGAGIILAGATWLIDYLVNG